MSWLYAAADRSRSPSSFSVNARLFKAHAACRSVFGFGENAEPVDHLVVDLDRVVLTVEFAEGQTLQQERVYKTLLNLGIIIGAEAPFDLLGHHDYRSMVTATRTASGFRPADGKQPLTIRPARSRDYGRLLLSPHPRYRRSDERG